MSQHYVGTKIIQAEPMNRGDYVAKRGRELPADENAADEGYLVKYPDGYISWSPKAVFEEAYLPLGEIGDKPPHQQRVIAEKAQLDDRLWKLNDFVITEKFESLVAEEQKRLLSQQAAMTAYSNVLRDRLLAF